MASTSKVPFSELDEVNQPISPYATTKRSGELLCFNYHHLYGLKTACLRFFTVYGPAQRPEMAIHKFTDLLAKGQPIDPCSAMAHSRRDYTFVERHHRRHRRQHGSERRIRDPQPRRRRDHAH